MRPYVITTDSSADLPEEYIKEHHLYIQPLYYKVGDTIYDGIEKKMDIKDFYDSMRNGEMPTTMASNPDFITKQFTSLVEEGYDIIHIGFSSGLSSSYNNARFCADDVMQEHPDATIRVIDSLAASMGQGLLVHKALELKEMGKTMEEVITWIEENKLHLCHQFTVDNLFHLQRGGRVSKATAIIGTIVNIKPVLHVDDEGHLINTGTVRGRKKSLNALVDNMEKTVGDYNNDIVFISHGDCIDDANYVADLVKKKLGIPNVLINYVSQTIGSHTGPGVVTLFYLGEKR